MKWLNRMIYRMVQRAERDIHCGAEAVPIRQNNMERLFGDCQPALIAFQIENGYVMRSMQTGPAYDGMASGFTYCKDHTAIAEHIVTEAAKQRLNLDPRAAKDAAMKQQSFAYGGSASISAGAYAQTGGLISKSP